MEVKRMSKENEILTLRFLVEEFTKTWHESHQHYSKDIIRYIPLMWQANEENNKELFTKIAKMSRKRKVMVYFFEQFERWYEKNLFKYKANLL